MATRNSATSMVPQKPDIGSFGNLNRAARDEVVGSIEPGPTPTIVEIESRLKQYLKILHSLSKKVECCGESLDKLSNLAFGTPRSISCCNDSNGDKGEAEPFDGHFNAVHRLLFSLEQVAKEFDREIDCFSQQQTTFGLRLFGHDLNDKS